MTSQLVDDTMQIEDELLQSTDEETPKLNLLNSKIDSKQQRTKSGNQNRSNRKSTSAAPVVKKTSDAKHNELLSFLKDIKQQNNDTNQEITTLKKTFDGKFTAIDQEISSNKKTVNGIVNRIEKMENRIDEATHDKELAKQIALKNNISIFGFPHAEGEDIGKIAVAIFKAFGCDFAESDFSAVYRSAGKLTSTIIVKFNDFTKKLSALESKAKKPVTIGDIAICGEEQKSKPVFINNHVTPFFARLLAVGRQGVKDKKIISCWIGSGGCLVKVKDGDKPKLVRSMSEMAKLTDGTGANLKRNKPDFASPSTEQDRNRKRND